MSKKRKTVSLDDDLHDNLQKDPNASQTVNGLLREYYAAGRSKEAATNKLIAEKESELESAKTEKARIESRIGKLEREVEQLRDRLNSLNDKERKQIEAVVGLIEEDAFDAESLHEDNILVQQRSENAGMQADRFIQEVRERL